MQNLNKKVHDSIFNINIVDIQLNIVENILNGGLMTFDLIRSVALRVLIL